MSKTDQILRSYGAIRIGSEQSDDRTVEFVISTADRDRHGTVIPISAWNLDNYNANGIVAYQHETGGRWERNDPDYIIGSGQARIEGDDLIGVAKFEPAEINELAEKIYQKVLHGTLKATSVGFIPAKGHWGLQDDGEDTGTYYFDEVELLEFSVVNIPSNPKALARSADDFTDYLSSVAKTSEQKKSVQCMHMRMYANIHNYLTHNPY